MPELEELVAAVVNMCDVAKPPRSCTEERLSIESKAWVQGLVFDSNIWLGSVGKD